MNTEIRKEERYILKISKLDKFIKKLRSTASQEKFKTNYNHTLYFNNSDHEIPFGVSIKGRRYSPWPFNGNLNPDEEWIFEIKREVVNGDIDLRKKQRKKLSLGGIFKELSSTHEIEGNPLNSSLRPYI